MGGSSRKVKPKRTLALTKKKKVVKKAKAEKVMKPCHFCGDLVPEVENLCAGCGVVICDKLECDHGDAPWGKHQPEDHQDEVGDHDDE